MTEETAQHEGAISASFCEGDNQLPLPQYDARVYVQELEATAKPRHKTRKHLFSYNGRRAYFRASQSRERLLGARYNCKDYEIIVVKEQVGKTINGGKAALLVCAEAHVTSPPVEVHGEMYRVLKYHVWSPNIDFQKRHVSEAEVDLLVPYEGIEETDIEDTVYVQSTKKQPPPRRDAAGSHDIFSRKFTHVEGSGFKNIPPRVEAGFKDFCHANGYLPPCTQGRTPERTLLKYDGRDVKYCVRETGKELDVAQFRFDQHYFTVIQEKSGNTIANGQAVLLGKRVGGAHPPYTDLNGTKWISTYYDIWQNGSTTEGSDGQVMKLIKVARQNSVGRDGRDVQRHSHSDDSDDAAPYEQTNTQGSSETSQHGAFRQTSSDNPIVRERDERIASFSSGGEGASRGSKRTRPQESLPPLQRRRFDSDNRHGATDVATSSGDPTTASAYDDTGARPSPILLDSPEPRARSPPPKRFAAFVRPVMNSTVKHEFVFVSRIDGQEALRRPAKYCKTVQMLFAQAQKARIADEATMILSVSRDDRKPVLVVRDDPDDFEKLLKSLDYSEQKEEIIVAEGV